MYHIIKRLFDIIISILGLVILSPLFLVLSICVKVSSKGSIFFKHSRVGKNGKPLYIYKFRTMVPNAEELIASFTPEQRREWEENYKIKDDPRTTRLGKFLRKTSLDELPQLLNIIKGEMSLVGPRPVIEDELAWYGENKDKFLSVKPGLTGWWASHGRSKIAYPERCQLELYYVDHASLWLDLKILFLTVGSLFDTENAR